ncbi:uncharacterized protein LOC114843425 isoform X2 [Betta splendens]|uniref:Uncharacterized protein LOC114843425 isoform X2 n=1 Tax=Betta splendens TaxID=158456 RepID=A0A6P7KTH8_BETSP|nr:uncharacterized protein LOC114843425 isoform X2 [Betta splendens]
MQMFTCFLTILLLASVVVTASVRARRENVLSFITGNRNPPSKPVADDDSEDLSDAKSAEDFDTNGFKDAVKDLDSHEIMIPAVVEKDKAPPGRTTAAGQVVDTSSAVVPDSDEEMVLGAHLPGRQSSRSPGGQKTGSPSAESSRSLVHGGSRELLDGDSLEHNTGRLVPQGNKNTDYDETREYNSMESPRVRPEHRTSTSFVPAMS